MKDASANHFHAYLALQAGLHTMEARVRWCDEAIDLINQRIKRQSTKPKTKRTTTRKR